MENRNFFSSEIYSGIRFPDLLHIHTNAGISYGANQSWYPTWIGRMGGCGPTTASNLFWYLAASRPAECGGLFDGDAREKKEMLRLMRSVWPYIKPGRKGVNKASMLTEGAIQYGAKHSVTLFSRILEIPEAVAERPAQDEVLDFLTRAFEYDLPVAFLNLNNGTLENLESWHWVTLVSVTADLQAEMYDQSRRQIIDVGQWLTSTTVGGAFVSISPAFSSCGHRSIDTEMKKS